MADTRFGLRRFLRAVAAIALVASAAACDDGGSAPSTSAPSSTTPASSTAPVTTAPATTAPATTTEPGTSAPATATPTSAPGTTVPASTAPTTTTPGELVLAAYFVRDEHVALAHRTVPYTVATSRAALTQLLAGPSEPERALGFSTAVPDGSQLAGVDIDAGGKATVDLTAPFESGGGTLSMSLRLAQVVYTVTQFPTVSSVVFAIDGVPVEVFGSEGIVLDHPLTRADFEDATPAIFVDDPAPFDHVARQLRVHGTANVFEATFMVRVTDSNGQVIYEHFQMATSGTGTRGTFDFVLDLSAAATGRASLRLWEPSAKDGSDTNVVEIPVDL